MRAIMFLFVVTLVNVSCDVIHDDDGNDGGCDESPWVCRQLAEMRRVIQQQNGMIVQQNRRIDDQSSMIFQQNRRIDDQSSMIVKQNRRIDEQSSMIVQQNRRIDDQSSMIVQQNRRIDDQSSMIVQQNRRIDDQSSMIVQQSSVIGLLQTEVSEQGSLIRKLQEELVTLKTEKENPEDVISITQTSTETSVGSNQRDVASRSDDGGPLEAVVNQMSQQLTTMSAEIQALKNTDQALQNTDQVLQNANSQQDLNIQDARTSTFVHWGSSHCPSDAQLVYSGVVGGTNYDQPGGGSNYLCLTMSPIFSDHAIPSGVAYLYGSEYETYTDAHVNMDPMCAVCRSSHSTTIMIPGTNVCTPGWTKQYDGFLMADYYNHAGASEFVCVDSAMESRPGSNADQNGILLFFTVTQCGSLPCEPYVDSKIVTCVVCSK